VPISVFGSVVRNAKISFSVSPSLTFRTDFQRVQMPAKNRAIARHGITVGDVPTDIHRFRGRIGVWLTSSESAAGHGLFLLRCRQDRLPPDGRNPRSRADEARWLDWAPLNVTPETVRALHGTAGRFESAAPESWYIYFGVIPPLWIGACADMTTGTLVLCVAHIAGGRCLMPAAASDDCIGGFLPFCFRTEAEESGRSVPGRSWPSNEPAAREGA
jgi:hypothetical protein